MSTLDADLIPEAPPPAGADAVVAGARPATARLLGAALAAGLLAAFASGPAGEAVYGRYAPRLSATAGIPTPGEAAAATARYRAGVVAESSLAFGLLGGFLGLALGAAGGLAGRSPRSAGAAALLGGFLGAAVAVAAVQMAVPLGLRLQPPDGDDLVAAVLLQGAIAGLAGAAAGSAFGLGFDRRSLPRALVGGLVGAVAGVVAYQLLGALAFPLAETSKPVAASAPARLSAHLLVAAFTSAGAALGVAARPVEGRSLATPRPPRREPSAPGRGNK
ncbi:hypothetical protein [Paludisphaera mucosa]|uniref:Uncharacterized protein n=1 Tax=Paludisphaera mucosa TaxID=3030827 RepID=A0ABT6FIT2_9BACT|nr:hypothetical protein [Paludisphaera mucosa]MDG3007460.1 hypothetical protein [Paludisphaera mucosa]